MLIALKEIAYHTSIDIHELVKAAERISVNEKGVYRYSKSQLAVEELLIPKLLTLTGNTTCTFDISAIKKNRIIKNKNEPQILTKEESGKIKFLSSLEEYKNRGFRAGRVITSKGNTDEREQLNIKLNWKILLYLFRVDCPGFICKRQGFISHANDHTFADFFTRNFV